MSAPLTALCLADGEAHRRGSRLPAWYQAIDRFDARRPGPAVGRQPSASASRAPRSSRRRRGLLQRAPRPLLCRALAETRGVGDCCSLRRRSRAQEARDGRRGASRGSSKVIARDEQRPSAGFKSAVLVCCPSSGMITLPTAQLEPCRDGQSPS